MIEKFGKVKENVLIRDYTTYKLSGKIAKVVYPSNLNDLIDLLKYLKEEKIKYKIIGNGSNLIFIGDYDGVIIKLDKFDSLKIDGNIVEVGASYSLIKLALVTARLGLSGLEFASGIPATVGGAVYMNAGAYKREMSDVIKEVMVIDDNLMVRKVSLKDLNFNYRSSILKEKNYVCIGAKIELTYGKKEEILEVIKKRKKRRLETQPLNFPSAGSVFRNPDGDYAGRLIEEINLKGEHINDAMVSEKHANFIVNNGNASGKDIACLINLVKNKVKQEYGITLILEQEIIE